MAISDNLGPALNACPSISPLLGLLCISIFLLSTYHSIRLPKHPIPIQEVIQEWHLRIDDNYQGRWNQGGSGGMDLTRLGMLVFQPGGAGYAHHIITCPSRF